MPEWIARIAIDVVFEAKDANEAGEIAENALTAPESYAGFKIRGRSNVWLVALKEEPAELTDA